MKGMKDSVQVSTPSLHKHDLSHTTPTSFDFYQFRPVLIQELYPKDEITCGINDYFVAKPLAGRVYGRFFKNYAAFFVPDRLLWDKFEDFLSGGSSGKLTFNFPHIKFEDVFSLAGSLIDKIESETDLAYKAHYSSLYRNMLDYWKDCGLPSEILYNLSSQQIAAQLDDKGFVYPLRNFLACRQIWFDWFRDQNLIGDDARETYCPKSFNTDGYVPQNIDATDYSTFVAGANSMLSALPIAVEKDYFTTALAEPQRGDAAFVPVKLPSSDLNPGFSATANGSFPVGVEANSNKVGKAIVISSNPNSSYITQFLSSNMSDVIGMFEYNSIRLAKALTKYIEKNGIAGGADLQQLLAHWGIAPNPAVFQRTTYIGSVHHDINTPDVVSPISTDTGSSVAGEVVSRCQTFGDGNFHYKATEHGLFVIVQFCRPENYYVGGIRREFMHGLLGNGRFDFFTPEMEPTGFQPQYAFEKTSEVFKQANNALPSDATSGYVPRYAETKRQYNEIRGQLAFAMNQINNSARNFGALNQLSENELFINTGFTMVYGYPADLQYDKFFETVNPKLDHFEGYIHFDIELLSTRHEYASPLIEDAKGNDITLPYAGVRM